MLLNTSANKGSSLLSTVIPFDLSLGYFFFNRCKNYILGIEVELRVSLLTFNGFMWEKWFVWKKVPLLEGPISLFPHSTTPPPSIRILIFIIVFFQIYSKVLLSSKQKTVALLIWTSRRAVAICLVPYKLVLMLFHQ